MKNGNKSKILSPVTVVLVLAAATGLMASAIISGVMPGFVIGGIHSHSPTITYEGSVAVSYVGYYQVIQAQPLCDSAFPPCFEANETIFMLSTRNETIRLVFYCGTTMKSLTTLTGWVDMCSNVSQLQITAGICMQVKGTLLQPSSWPSRQYLPLLRFDGDLFVFSYNEVPAATCS